MKKLLYSIIAFAGILAASCATDEDKLVFDPSSSVAPSLGTLAGGALASDGADLTFEFTGPSYNIDGAKLYTLYISDSQDFTRQEKLAATVSGTSVTVKQSSLNSAILNLGGEADSEFTVYLRLDSWLANNKNVGVETSLTKSNVISATFIPYNQLILDKDVYDHIWVQGDYCGWSHDKSQFLYNYSKDGKTFSGVIDFAGKASGGIKFTGAASWDNSTGNWGSEAQAEAAEAGSLQLINGDGSQNIVCYSKRFYGFTLDKNTLLLSKDWGADVIGIVGGFNDWGGQPDIEMNYNKDYVRFWADAEFASDTKIKFRADAAWDYNWGKDAGVGGDDITVTAGKYRVYLDLNKKTVELSATMYGKDEPTAGGDSPEPEKPGAWSLVGTLYDSGWNSDFDLTNTSGDIWQIRSVEITASDEFKIRADHEWSVSVGGPEKNSTSTIDPGNVYGVFKPELGKAFAVGGENIQVGEAGVYDITYDYAGQTILIEEHKAVYSLIGEIGGNSWTNDFVMTQDGDVWTSPVVNITGGFKIRYDYSWDEANTYGVAEGFTPEIGKEFTAVQPGGNITVPAAGDYKVSFNAKTLAVTITAVAFPEHLYMIGNEFGSWDWASDGIVELTPVNSQEGEFWTVRYFTANQGFKYAPEKAWGKDFHSLTTNDGYTVDGGNCVVAEDGFYTVHVDLKREMVHIEPARIYGIGNCFGGWDAKMDGALFKADGKTLKATLAADGELRMYVESSIADSDWWTREFIILDGKIVCRGNDGDQQRVACTKGQEVTLDFNAGTGTIK